MSKQSVHVEKNRLVFARNVRKNIGLTKVFIDMGQGRNFNKWSRVVGELSNVYTYIWVTVRKEK